VIDGQAASAGVRCAAGSGTIAYQRAYWGVVWPVQVRRRWRPDQFVLNDFRADHLTGRREGKRAAHLPLRRLDLGDGAAFPGRNLAGPWGAKAVSPDVNCSGASSGALAFRGVATKAIPTDQRHWPVPDEFFPCLT